MRRAILVSFALTYLIGYAHAADIYGQPPSRRDLTEQGKQSQGGYSRPAPNRNRLHEDDLRDGGDAPGRQRSSHGVAGSDRGAGRRKTTGHDDD
jgi:hypothetical protein